MTECRLHWLLPLLFIALCGPLGAFLAINLPPGQVPDEHNHVIKAYSLLRGEFFGHRETIPLVDGTSGPQQGVDGDMALQAVSNEPSPARLTLKHWAEVHAVQWGANGFVALGPIAGYWPAFYLPAAAALGAAQWTGTSPFESFVFARLMNLASYLGAGTAALLLARRGQALLFCALSVPMSLHLAASVNQDGLLIATSVLAVALLTRSGAGGPAPLPFRHDVPRLWAAALIGCIVLAKPPYLPLAGLLLLPFPALRLRDAWIGRLGLVCLVLFGAVAWTWITVHFVSTSVVRPPAEAGPLWPGPRPAIFAGTDMAGQMRVLLAKPIRFLTLPWHTLIHEAGMIDQAIGVLGYLNVFFPRWFYGLWTWAVLSAALADLLWRRASAPVLPAWQIPLPLLFAAASVLGIYLSQYLSWTEVGGSHVEGPQGRYFLPLVPVLAFALPSLGRSPALGLVFRSLPIAAGLAGILIVPGVVIRFFYMH